MRHYVPMGMALLLLTGGAAREAAAQRRAPGTTATYFATARAVRVPVVANGERLDRDALMIREAGRTLLPMRSLFSALGAQVVWNARERAVYAWRTDGTGVRFGVGEREAQLLLMPGPNQTATVTETRVLDAPATLIQGTLYVPVRAASELLGTEVRWDAETATVHIGTNLPEAAGDGSE
jgi:hypothetical protein